MNTEKRIRKNVEKWFITEPLLFGVWMLHTLSENNNIRNMRVGKGKIEYNSDFIQSLDDDTLDNILLFEGMRILLKHPYARKKKIASAAYLASNITLQEYLDTPLPIPAAKDVFNTNELDKQYFELYYEKLLEKNIPSAEMYSGAGGGENRDSGAGDIPSAGDDGESGEADDNRNGGSETRDDHEKMADGESEIRDDHEKMQDGESEARDDHEKMQDGESEARDDHEKTSDSGKPLNDYLNPLNSGMENTRTWDRDEFEVARINDSIRSAHQSDTWGNMAGRWKEIILATLIPKVDYRKMLRGFRASIISHRRMLTRMKPSRRYGFQYMGSKYDFSTKLLFAVDVSGSISTQDVKYGYSVINQLFKYGIETVDVIQFDTSIKGAPLTFRKAKKDILVQGRGGTDFNDLMNYIDIHRDYDGLVIFTDGYAGKPRKPDNRKTRIMWLFNTESNYNKMKNNVSHTGKAAFIKER